ncbi:MAG: ASCH domain-containing protein, partial [Oscillospiraceae bacterium]|nr:ASCH domain-containing protein [Oscillospiraceae bacterium]
EELWERSGLTGTYEAWSFAEAPDKLAELVVRGIKTATCSAYDLYRINGEPVPRAVRIQKGETSWHVRASLI